MHIPPYHDELSDMQQNMGRHVNWLRLKDQSNGLQFRMLNTHFSLTPEERIQQAEILREETSQYDSNFPQLMAGDFNSVLGSEEVRVLQSAGWIDTLTTTADVAEDDKTPAKNRLYLRARKREIPCPPGL